MSILALPDPILTCAPAASKLPLARRKTLVLVVGTLVLTLSAFGFRLFRLGEWSFWGDELSTFQLSHAVLTENYWNPPPQTPPFNVFAHSNPIGWALLGFWHRVCGMAEFWVRLPVAVAGAVSVVVAVTMLRRSRGGWAAAALAAMLLAWPWHLFHSQNHRVYTITYLFGVMGCIWADAGFAQRCGRKLVWAGVALTLAALTHNAAALMPAMMIGWGVALVVFDRDRQSGRLLVYLTPALAGILLNVVLLAKFTMNYPTYAIRWYGPVHLLSSLIYNLGLPVVLAALAAVGWAIVTRRKDLYWNIFASAGLAVAALVMAKVASFRADYLFAITAPVHILAAVAIGEAARRLRPLHWAWSATALAAVPLLMSPSIASHYIDGDRADYGAAAAWIRPQLRPGDVVWSNQRANVTHYLGAPGACSYPKNPAAEAERILAEGGRVWVADGFSSAGITGARLEWLRGCFRLQKIVQRTRLDYHQNGVGIWLADRDDRDCAAPAAQ